jgi:hypothetical protein
MENPPLGKLLHPKVSTQDSHRFKIISSTIHDLEAHQLSHEFHHYDAPFYETVEGEPQMQTVVVPDAFVSFHQNLGGWLTSGLRHRGSGKKPWRSQTLLQAFGSRVQWYVDLPHVEKPNYFPIMTNSDGWIPFTDILFLFFTDTNQYPAKYIYELKDAMDAGYDDERVLIYKHLLIIYNRAMQSSRNDIEG